MNACNVSYEKIIFYLSSGFMVSLLVFFGGSTNIFNLLRPVTLKMPFINCLLICLSATICISAPQSGGVSAKLDWWKDTNFNSASSNYLYTSFRYLPIFNKFFFILLKKYIFNREKVFEPLMDKLLSDVKILKEGQTFAEDVGFGALSAGLVALVGMAYLLVRVNIFNKNLKGFNTRNKNEATRVLQS